MTRLRFLLVTMGGAVASVLGLRRKERVRGLDFKTYRFEVMENVPITAEQVIQDGNRTGKTMPCGWKYTRGFIVSSTSLKKPTS